MGFPCYFYDISMGFLLGFLKGCRWYFYGIPIGFQKDVYVISIGFLLLWDFHDVSMIFLEDSYGISEGMLWEFYGILMGFTLDSHGISIRFL